MNKIRPVYVAAVCAVVGLLAAGAVLAFSGGDEPEADSTAVVESPTATATSSPTPVPPSPTPTATPQPEPQAESQPSPGPAPRSCNEIRASGYQSDAERTFFLASCTGTAAAGPTATPRPAQAAQAPATAPGAPAPTSTPRPAAPAAAPPSQPNSGEETYRSLAIQYHSAFITSWNAEVSGAYSGQLQEVNELAAVLRNYNSQLATIPPPARWAQAHNNISAMLLELATHIESVRQLTTESQRTAWVAKMSELIDKMNATLRAYRISLG